MNAECSALVYVAALMPECSASEHRVLTAIALECGELGSAVKLSITDLEQLTGLSRSGVRKGLAEATSNGWLNQTRDGNSFTYLLCHDVTQNVSPRSTKRVTRKHSEESSYVTRKHKTLHEVTHLPEGVHLYKDSKLASVASEDQKTDAYAHVAYASSHYVAGWLAKRGFNFERAYEVWGEQLEALWKACVNAPSRKPGDQARFRFQDACEGSLELGIKPPTPKPPPAAPDENGIILGEIYWDRERGRKVRPIDYRADWNLYAAEVPIDETGDPVSGRYQSIPPECLQSYRAQCAA